MTGTTGDGGGKDEKDMSGYGNGDRFSLFDEHICFDR